MDISRKNELNALAVQIRMALLEAIHSLGSGHIGGALSIADVLAVLYGGEMRVDPRNPQWPERDKLVVSKGHAGPAVYGTLAVKGFFPYEELKTLNRPHTRLPSHCDRIRTPGIDMTCGSLGQGISAAAGQAMAAKIQGRDLTVYAIVGDGEIEEGQVWEAAMFAGAKNLDNFIVFVDKNNYQVGGDVHSVLNYGDPAEIFHSFGFEVINNVNGHDIDAIREAVVQAKAIRRPVCIVCNTVKGKGFVPAENERRVHNMPLTHEDYLASCAYIDQTC